MASVEQAVFERARVRLYYEVHGEGFPLLAVAPGGLRSSVQGWNNRPIEPAMFGDEYKVITLDQRNAGRSWAPVSAGDGWHSYADDHLALLDHLGVDRFHVIGMCIGGAYALRLAKVAPERIASAVLIQPIGLSDNRDVFAALCSSWRDEVRARHPEASDSDYEAFFQNMFGGDFTFSATAEDVAACPVPMLVLLGDDEYHPASISRRVAELAPRASLIEDWKQDPASTQARERIRNFFREHTHG